MRKSPMLIADQIRLSWLIRRFPKSFSLNTVKEIGISNLRKAYEELRELEKLRH